MQTKTIKKHIKEKVDEWLKSITDRSLAKDLEDHIIVTGGCIASMFLNEKVNDFDIYIKDRDVLKRLCVYYTVGFDIEILDGRDKAKLMEKYGSMNEEEFDHHNAWCSSVRNLKEDQIKLFCGTNGGKKVNQSIPKEDLKYHPLFFSPNAISLSNDVQVIIRFWGEPKVIHESFDFVHPTNYWTRKDGLVTNVEALESLLTKQLRYQGSKFPVTSIVRARKFIKRGFNIGAGEYLKIMFQISELDLCNPDVLEDQLIGVDVAYFDALINALRAKQKNEPSFKLSSEYLNLIIDKIFNETDEEDS